MDDAFALADLRIVEIDLVMGELVEAADAIAEGDPDEVDPHLVEETQGCPTTLAAVTLTSTSPPLNPVISALP